MMFRQISTYMIANAVSAAFGFVSVVLFTRMLSPHEYGIYVVGTGVAGVISTLLFGWIKFSVLRFESEGGRKDVRTTALYAYGGLMLVSPLVVAVTWLIAENSSTYVVPAVFVAFMVGLFEFVQEIFRSRQQTGAYMWSVILRAVLTVIFSAGLVMLFGMGGQGLLVSVACSYLATLLVYAPGVWRRPRHPFDVDLLKDMLRFGIPMTASSFVFVLHTVLDRMIIVTYMGETAAGVYGAAADLVRQIILFPGVAIGSATIPVAIRLLTQDGREATNRHLTETAEMLLAVLMPMVVGLALVAPGFASLILGPEFRDAAAMLMPILVFAWLFRSISYQFVHVSFQLAKKPGLMGVQGLIILAINVAAMFVLVPRFQLVGAAYALLIAEIGGAIAGYFLSYRAHRLPFELRPILKVSLATATMAVPTVIVGRHPTGNVVLDLAAPIITGVVVYTLAGIALNLAGVRVALTKRLRLA
ncbi:MULTISPECIES: oligosaccharide flippase family protein [unclassified Rhizobium]|uniref:oligosaccharide flippase family protein n=1 Tax=unclassified Rhizobium TaxID=2613769 RepID=UPI00161427C6|nr:MULTISPECIES: oligosaccharide flippase family protein [unclassified Rhizobium]MBB3320260.1 O-antigen/teichoic acid export membrane protein [Rhizobium sp. BK181]MCS4096016.1 O-antigen/teichoic acid export membrane protein [Rhizobium sp. BK176]